MKKVFVMLVVVMMVMMTLISCNSNATSQEPKIGYDVEATCEEDIVDGIVVGRTYNYGSYYVFVTHDIDHYLGFLETMTDIEIIDISITEYKITKDYLVTYKLEN